METEEEAVQAPEVAKLWEVIKSFGSLCAHVWLIGATIKGQFIAPGLERNLGSLQGPFVHVISALQPDTQERKSPCILTSLD